MRPLDRLVAEAVDALPPGATCDAIAAWIMTRRANALRALLAGYARHTLRRWDEPPWTRAPEHAEARR